jgi:acyl-CoA thioesterase
LLILVDIGAWPATQSQHNQDAIIAPSIDLACEFHRIRRDAEWLFVQGVSPSANDGLIASHQQVWSDRGELLASGVSQLLCRPVKRD